MEKITLRNGVAMPMVGFGTLRISPSECETVVYEALHEGYRMIDTAPSYFNEAEVGRAIKKSEIKREDIFVSTKVWVQDAGYHNTLAAFEKSCERLGMETIDLYLIHQPFNDYYGSWQALETLYQQGRVKAIGVCNFDVARLVDLCLNAEIAPMVNQVEVHPFYQQNHLIEVANQYGCQIQAWGPLSEGQKNIFFHPTLMEIAKKYQKTVAQVILRWHYQRNIITIPKTIHRNLMKENLAIFDFSLTDEDMAIIKILDIGYSEIVDLSSAKTAKWFNKYKIHE